MESLPDEILVKIFSRLDVKTRLQMLSVNQCWRDLMPFDHLNIRKVLERPSVDAWASEWPIESATVTSALRQILPKIGPKVKSVEFGKVELVPVHIDLIRQLCPNIRCVDLRKVDVSEPNDFNFTAIQQMTSVKSLKIDSPDSDLGGLSSDWPAEVSTRFLQDVADVVRLLHLEEFHVHFRSFPPAFAAPNLTTLELHCWRLTDAQLAQICTVSPNLTRLDLEGCYELSNYMPIGQLSRLKDLKVDYDSLNSTHMEVICGSCTQLSRIHVQLNGIQFAQIKWLRHLPNLKFLAINLDNETNLDRRIFGRPKPKLKKFSFPLLADIPQNWAIEELQIYADLPDAILLDLSDKSRRLKRLRLLSGDLSDNLIVQLSNRWELLEELNIGSVRSISVEGIVQLGLRENLRRLDIGFYRPFFSAANIRLLLAKRQQLNISTPLIIRLGYYRPRDFNFRLFRQLSDELKVVKVQLVCYRRG